MRTALAVLIAASPAGAAEYPVFEDLALGRSLWLANCETCHGYGVGGAPIPTRPSDWAKRLKQPIEVLHQHALNGFIGADYGVMPARGGNDALTDAEVTAAVDYMRRFALAHQPQSPAVGTGASQP